MRGAFADTDRKGFDLELARDGNLDIEALTLEQLQKLYETVDVMAGSVNNEEARENFMMMRAII